MKIVTWNVNSIRARMERLLPFLERHSPDALCLQETKVIDADFPTAEIEKAGYQCVFHGQKTYNGVAILSKTPIKDVVRGFEDGGDDSQARMIAATVEGVRLVNVYVPNGKEVGDEKYHYKLEWMKRLGKFLEGSEKKTKPLLLCGDFNVAPADLDVHDPKAWEEQILCSTAEREALQSVSEWGLKDSFRHHYPDMVAYSWWDYRSLGFQKNRGLRIDLHLMTSSLLKRCTDCMIDRDERKGKGASDHAPVIAEIK